MLDIVWIGIAFGFGLVARQIGLPPLVGYLLTGFLLHSLGVTSNPTIAHFADLGVTLLLFSIGLKLKIKSLGEPQVWGVASAHLGLSMLIAPVMLGLGALGIPYLSDLTWTSAALLAFALAFSSTVFAIKVLEEKGETGSYYGTIAIGILIMQDLAAVLFLAFTAGKLPTLWSPLLLLLIPGRRLIFWLLERSGHGELLVLFGLTLGLGGYHVFEAVGIKGDLGALILGVMIAIHPKTNELAKGLLSFKDLFLVGFFVSIGLSGAPSLPMDLVALVLLLLLPLKFWAFHLLLLFFHLRSRTSMLTALALANYSEFGLIVAALGAELGWIGAEWPTILALALSASFVIGSPLNARSHELYERFSSRLCRLQGQRRLPPEAEIDPGDADVLVLGMGRVGTGAYDTMAMQRGRRPVGIDADPDMVRRHQAAGRNVIHGSATDPDFWHRLQCRGGSFRLVLLAMPKVSENVFAATHLKAEGFDGVMGAVAKFNDDEPLLRAAGVDLVFNLYAEAGAGFAQHVSGGSKVGLQSEDGEDGGVQDATHDGRLAGQKKGGHKAAEGRTAREG